MSPIDAEICGLKEDMELRAAIISGRQGAFSNWTGYVTPTEYQPVEKDFQALAGETVTTYAQTGSEVCKRQVRNSTDTIVGAVDGGTVWDAKLEAHPLKAGNIWVNPITRVKYVGR